MKIKAGKSELESAQLGLEGLNAQGLGHVDFARGSQKSRVVWSSVSLS